MAKEKAKQASGSQSIVRHPLFPTIVAFWFAALFGLGSLAVRTSLLEALVIGSRIDLIVPQTAPPLGITARILIALGMAAIGSILGFVLAVRLARPKPEIKQERVRTARGFGAAGNAVSAPSRYLPDDEQAQEERGAEPERRRSLVASNQGEPAYHDEPHFINGMAPHILDVTTFDVDPIDRRSAAPEQVRHGDAALDLDQFAAVAPLPGPGFQSVPTQTVQPALQESAIGDGDPVIDSPIEAAPAGRRLFEAPAEGHQRFDPPLTPCAHAEIAEQVEAPREEAPGEQARQSFDPPHAHTKVEPAEQAEAQQEDVPVQHFAQDADGSPATPAYVAPVTSPLQFRVESPAIAEAPAPVPTNEGHAHGEPAFPEEFPAAAAEADDAEPMATLRNKVAPMPSFDSEPGHLHAPEPVEAEFHEAAPEAVEQPVAVPVAAKWAPPLGAAARRLANADLSELSPVELIERLALSLQRRGQAVSIAPVAEMPCFEPLPAFAAAPEPVEIAADIPAQEAPAADIPLATHERAASDESGDSSARFALPAALRPIDFSHYEQEGDLPDYVPARSIAMPSFTAETSVQVPQPEPQPEPAAEAPQPKQVAMPRFGRAVEQEQAAVKPEDDVLEAGYSSLLDMSKPVAQRQQFVRVIDPQADADAAEPVVIFPGQAMRAGIRFAPPSPGPVVAPVAPPPSLAETSSQPRRFDAPAAAPRNPEETERALRSALSTLQRMSGAA